MSDVMTDEYGNAVDVYGTPLDADGNPIGTPPVPTYQGIPDEQQGGSGSGPGVGYDASANAELRAEARWAAEDTPYDEYGIEKPHVAATKRWGEVVAPPEVMGDPGVSDGEKLARSVAAPIASLYGHFRDQVPMPLLGEIAHQNEEKHYHQQREAAEAEAQYQRDLAEYERHVAEYDRQLAEAQAQYAPEQATPAAEHERQVAEAQSWYAADPPSEAPAEANASY